MLHLHRMQRRCAAASAEAGTGVVATQQVRNSGKLPLLLPARILKRFRSSHSDNTARQEDMTMKRSFTSATLIVLAQRRAAESRRDRPHGFSGRQYPHVGDETDHHNRAEVRINGGI
jgi:hypothetical protein